MRGLRIIFDAGVPEWAAAAAAGAFLFFARGRLRELPRGLAALRLTAFLLVAGSLLKPAYQRLEDRYAKPRLDIILDRGPSMGAEDDAGSPRLTRAADWLRENRERIERRAEVSLLGASGGASRLAWEDLETLAPSAQGLEPSSTFADLTKSGAPPSRVWLFSDGAFDDGPKGFAALDLLGAPVDSVGVGPKTRKRSVSVAGIRSPDFVFLHGRFDVAVALEAHRLERGRLTVRLSQDGRVLGTRRLEVERDYEMLETTFTVAAAVLGRSNYRIEIEGEDGGGTAAETVRSSREFGVEVIRQKYRIMYLAGRPSFEYSHLRAHLKEDPNHELVSFVILRNPDNISPVGDQELSLIPFPADEIFVKNLFEFDLFILENFAYWRFNLPVGYLENLKRFVSQGGALLVIGGSNAFTKGGYHGTPLEETLPVTLWPSADDFQAGLHRPVVSSPDNPLLQLGADADETRALWNALPPLDGFSRFESVRPGASVLLSHPTEKTRAGQPLPIVAVREFGRGKVMLVGTDSTWRWKLGGGRDWKLSSFYGRFWSRAVQYLTGSLELKKVKFSPLPDRMPPREPAVLTLHVFDQHFRPIPGADLDLKLAWDPPGKAGRRTPAFYEREPGVFQVELNDLADGRHTVRAVAAYRGQYWGEDSASFDWRSVKGEAPLNRKRLKRISDASGGRYEDLHKADAEALSALLPPMRKIKTVESRGSVWTWSLWLWLACGCLLAEWLLRRRWGYL